MWLSEKGTSYYPICLPNIFEGIRFVKAATKHTHGEEVFGALGYGNIGSDGVANTSFDSQLSIHRQLKDNNKLDKVQRATNKLKLTWEMSFLILATLLKSCLQDGSHNLI